MWCFLYIQKGGHIIYANCHVASPFFDLRSSSKGHTTVESEDEAEEGESRALLGPINLETIAAGGRAAERIVADRWELYKPFVSRHVGPLCGPDFKIAFTSADRQGKVRSNLLWSLFLGRCRFDFVCVIPDYRTGIG
jgi:hypothetical protein